MDVGCVGNCMNFPRGVLLWEIAAIRYISYIPTWRPLDRGTLSTPKPRFLVLTRTCAGSIGRNSPAARPINPRFIKAFNDLDRLGAYRDPATTPYMRARHGR